MDYVGIYPGNSGELAVALRHDGQNLRAWTVRNDKKGVSELVDRLKKIRPQMVAIARHLDRREQLVACQLFDAGINICFTTPWTEPRWFRRETAEDLAEHAAKCHYPVELRHHENGAYVFCPHCGVPYVWRLSTLPDSRHDELGCPNPPAQKAEEDYFFLVFLGLGAILFTIAASLDIQTANVITAVLMSACVKIVLVIFGIASIFVGLIRWSKHSKAYKSKLRARYEADLRKYEDRRRTWDSLFVCDGCIHVFAEADTYMAIPEFVPMLLGDWPYGCQNHSCRPYFLYTSSREHQWLPEPWPRCKFNRFQECRGCSNRRGSTWYEQYEQ